MVIDAILARTRETLAERKAARPLERLIADASPSDRDFEHALAGTAPAFILEIKPRSPSAGELRALSALDPVIGSYARHASAISVLTDEPFFGGSLGLLSRVRAAVPQPVLRKDFMLEPYQVYEARAAGADAVLLMLSVLDDRAYQACATAARELRMGVLTEVHTASELARAAALGARVIGINNRDLRTLEVSSSVTRSLAQQAPAGALVIAESGIRRHADAQDLAGLVDGFLVGSAVMRAAEPDRAVRELVYGATKICGLTRPEDAEEAARAGATHGGLVFAAGSPRRVTLDAAGEIAAAAPLALVGVFVNEAPRDVARVAVRLGLHAVQLHGDETRDEVAAVRALLPRDTGVWKAEPVNGPLPDWRTTGADLVLLDAPGGARRGGNGRPFDWAMLDRIAERSRYGLAGGLTPDNAGDASRYGFALLDVSTGVESQPGRKSAALVRRFLQARRGRRRSAAR